MICDTIIILQNTDITKGFHMIITLPQGLRIEVVDNTNLTVPVGTKATVSFEEQIDTESFSKSVMCLVDGHSGNGCLPFEQCKIITDNFKRNFKPAKA